MEKENHLGEMRKYMEILLVDFNESISSIYRKLLKNHSDSTNIIFAFIKNVVKSLI